MILTDGIINNTDTTGKSDYERYNGRNIDKTCKGKYRVRKAINGKTIYYGTYQTFDEAVSVRAKLEQCGWDKNILLTEEDKQKEYFKYIRRNSKFYYDINRPSNNKYGLPRYMGTVKTIEEALYYRDLAEKVDYNDIGKPQTLDLITDNPYIKEGLQYPLPDTLKQPEHNSTYGTGYIVEKSHQSFQVWYNKNYYGSYITYEYAEYIRLKLNEHQWDETYLDDIKKGYKEYYNYLLKFWRDIIYNPKNELYYCYRSQPDSDEKVYFQFKDPYDILYERDLYEKYDWDIDKVVELADPDEHNPYRDLPYLPPCPTRKVNKMPKSYEDYNDMITDMCFFIREFDVKYITDMAETLDTSRQHISVVLGKFNISWRDFVELCNSGEDPLSVLTYNETLVEPDLKRYSSKKNYIYKDKNRKYSPYIIQKGKIRYGTYKSRNDASKVVTRLKKVGWDKDKLPEILKKINYQPPKKSAKYIYKNKKATKKESYYITHYNNGCRTYYGSYKTRKDAERVVGELEKVDWDKNQLPSIKEKLGL